MSDRLTLNEQKVLRISEQLSTQAGRDQFWEGVVDPLPRRVFPPAGALMEAHDEHQRKMASGAAVIRNER